MSSTSVVITDFHKLPGGISQANGRQYLFPTVISRNIRGKPLYWTIEVRIVLRATILPPDHAELLRRLDLFEPITEPMVANAPMGPELIACIIVSSKTGEDGQIAKKDITIVAEGKNLGKKNATNVFCQALRDALGMYNKKKKKASGEGPDGAQVAPIGPKRYPPMLARIYSPQLWTEAAEAFIQPKYNGVRAVATITAAEGGVLIFYSRKGNIYPGLDYIGAELVDMLSAYWQEDRQLYLDGELFLPEMPLQTINSYARNSQKPGGVRPKYYIYDLFIANEPQMLYAGRKALLTEIFEDFLAEAQSSVLVNTYEIHNHEQAQTHYEAFLAAGFEGAIVRLNSVYSHSYNDYRSPALLKMKPTLDAEFEIVGYLAGAKGKTLGALIMVCKNEAGLVFNVTPALEIAERKRLFTKMAEIDATTLKTHFENNYLGKKLIVEFAEWSIDRVPQQPRTSMVLREWD